MTRAALRGFPRAVEDLLARAIHPHEVVQPAEIGMQLGASPAGWPPNCTVTESSAFRLAVTVFTEDTPRAFFSKSIFVAHADRPEASTAHP